ncbi:hypothetical protein PCE1_004654 [Barthelona sp. PCE]
MSLNMGPLDSLVENYLSCRAPDAVTAFQKATKHNISMSAPPGIFQILHQYEQVKKQLETVLLQLQKQQQPQQAPQYQIGYYNGNPVMLPVQGGNYVYSVPTSTGSQQQYIVPGQPQQQQHIINQPQEHHTLPHNTQQQPMIANTMIQPTVYSNGHPSSSEGRHYRSRSSSHYESGHKIAPPLIVKPSPPHTAPTPPVKVQAFENNVAQGQYNISPLKEEKTREVSSTERAQSMAFEFFS